MSSGLDDTAVEDHVDDVGEHGRGEAMGDDDCDAALGKPAEALAPDFGPGLHGAGGLVEDDGGDLGEEGARQSDAM